MKSKLTRLIRFFAFQVIMLLFALHVSGQSINGIEGTPTCPNCYNTSVIPSRVSSTLGISTVATDSAAFASGKGSIASGKYSTAFGYYSRASKHSSFAAGYRAKADSAYSVGLGYYSEAVNHYTFSFGKYVKASALNSMVIGKGNDSTSQSLNNDIPNSIMLGMGSTNPTVTIQGASTGTGSGKVGIGTSNPNEKLEIAGFVRTSDGYKVGTIAAIDGNRNYFGYNGTFSGTLSVTGTGNSTFAGNIGIGTTPTNGYKLSVSGKIHCTEVVVEALPWPDYVFEKGYQLMPVKELEVYIRTNKHLPNIPDAKTISDKGLSVGEMNAQLLKKVEELTLYIIEQQNALEDQHKEIEKIKAMLTR